jgi:hypothetical protein
MIGVKELEKRYGPTARLVWLECFGGLARRSVGSLGERGDYFVGTVQISQGGKDHLVETLTNVVDRGTMQKLDKDFLSGALKFPEPGVRLHVYTEPRPMRTEPRTPAPPTPMTMAAR